MTAECVAIQAWCSDTSQYRLLSHTDRQPDRSLTPYTRWTLCSRSMCGWLSCCLSHNSWQVLYWHRQTQKISLYKKKVWQIWTGEMGWCPSNLKVNAVSLPFSLIISTYMHDFRPSLWSCTMQKCATFHQSLTRIARFRAQNANHSNISQQLKLLGCSWAGFNSQPTSAFLSRWNLIYTWVCPEDKK